MTETVYIVTRGEYSDYQICGVFSSVERAEKFVDASCPEGEWSWHQKEDYRVEDYLIDDAVGYMLSASAQVEYVFWFDLDFNLLKHACNRLLLIMKHVVFERGFRLAPAVFLEPMREQSDGR